MTRGRRLALLIALWRLPGQPFTLLILVLGLRTFFSFFLFLAARGEGFTEPEAHCFGWASQQGPRSAHLSSPALGL